MQHSGCSIIILMQQLKIKQIADGLSYSRTEKLGKGAFGEVYLGFDDHRKLPCAFKIVNLQKVTAQVNAESLMKKMKDEIVNMQLARHPSLIEFYQAKQSPNNIYILCEYCNGQSLAKFLERRQYLPQWEALQLFKEILKGFYHLHKSNIVHRDIKPANLLMHHYSIKIADLGFSKVTESHEQMLESIVGTPLYMSPQIFEREKYTEKTDIWSLGVILYEMLYGRNPWAGSKNLFELKERVKRQVVFPEHPIVSNSLKVTIRQMLVVKQIDRISWEALFKQYLVPNTEIETIEVQNSLQMSDSCLKYFQNSMYLESHLQLPKITRDLSLLSQEELTQLLGRYLSSSQFYSEVLFLSKNKELLKDYYINFFQKRNQISFMVLLMNKILKMAQKYSVQLSCFCTCLTLLGYRFCLATLEELTANDQLILPSHKYSGVSGKFCYDRLLFLLFKRDMQVLRQQYKRFWPYFQMMLSRIQSLSLASIIKKDLSGIYENQQNQRRVIKFFTLNYMKKIYNILKGMIKSPNTMVSEEDQEEMKDEEHASPSLQVTVARMISQYLGNSKLFEVVGYKGGRNLIQKMYQWETQVKEQHYEQIKKSQPWKEESIDSFLKKQLVWSQMLLSQLSRPALS